MNKNLALFDFDGTITSSDTLFEFMFFVKSRFSIYWILMISAPILFLHKLGLISAKYAKETLLKRSIGGIPVEEFEALCKLFADTRLPKLVRPEALARIQWHSRNGDKICIVSASPENWIKPWAVQQNIEVISTKLGVYNGLMSGIIDGENCNGKEKVRRINQAIDLANYAEVYAYGDSKGDSDMLYIADHKFYRKFI